MSVDLEPDVEVDVVDDHLEQPGQRQQPGRHRQPAAHLDLGVPGVGLVERLEAPPPAGRPRCPGRSAAPARSGRPRPRSRPRAARASRTSPAARRSGPSRPAGPSASACRARWVATWPRLQPGSRLGAAPVLVGDLDGVAEQPLGRRGHQPAQPLQLLAWCPASVAGSSSWAQPSAGVRRVAERAATRDQKLSVAAHSMADVTDRLVVRGAREHNLRNISLDLPRDALIVFTGLSGLGQVEPGLRHHLRRGPAPLRRVAVGVRAAVPRPDGQAGRRLHRGPVAGGLDRPEVDQPQPALDGRHHHRGLRLPPAAVRPRRPAALPGLRRADQPAVAAADRRPADGAARRAPGSRSWRRWSAAARASTSRCSASWPPTGFSRARVDGEVVQLTDPPTLDKKYKHSIDVIVDRLAVKPTVKQRLTDSVETALGLAQGVVTIDFVDLDAERPGAGAPLLGEDGLPQRPRHRHRRARAAAVLLQRPVGRLPGVLRARHPDGGRPRAGRPRRREEPGRGGHRAVGLGARRRLLPSG